MRRVLWSVIGIFLAGEAALLVTYVTAPRGNTSQDRFDTAIVLGCPSELDGTASPGQRERVSEAVREFKTGRVAHLVVTGAAAHNRWVEADAESKLAVQMGVPAEDVVVESRSRNTIENARYSWELMRARGWKSAEIVSSGSHLARAGVIFAGYEAAGLKWRTHAALWPREYSWLNVAAAYEGESVKLSLVRWFGFEKRSWVPG